MDIDALALQIAAGFATGEFPSPPFPSYMARWVARELASMPAVQVDAALAAWPKPQTAERIGERTAGDLRAWTYRVEPGDLTVLLVVRAGALAYVSLAGGLSRIPAAFSNVESTFRILATEALSLRLKSEPGLAFSGYWWQSDGAPFSVQIDVERARYESLDSTSREALHATVAAIARDAALLLDRDTAAAPIVVRFFEPQTGDVHHAGPGRPGQIAELRL
ncbi:MAG: hypothetical protein JWO66_1064 [Candidatus Eremiobacteraeota bacterium]|nr:hypothetical protein [Candidatus Eremiobacteraeota bacterium]